jgi:hypothetical protein
LDEYEVQTVAVGRLRLPGEAAQPCRGILQECHHVAFHAHFLATRSCST